MRRSAIVPALILTSTPLAGGDGSSGGHRLVEGEAHRSPRLRLLDRVPSHRVAGTDRTLTDV